jgi:hypothetical protein
LTPVGAQSPEEVDRMKNNTWQKPAIAPAFGMPVYGPSSRAAHTVTCGVQAVIATTGMTAARVDAVRVKGLFPGSDAWSPPIS